MLERLPVVMIIKVRLLKEPLASMYFPGQDHPPLSTQNETYSGYDFPSELSVSPTQMLSTKL